MNWSKIFKITGFTLLIIACFAWADITWAQDSLGGEWSKYLKGNLPGFSQTTNVSGEDLALSLTKRAISLLRTTIGIIAVVFGVIFGMQLIFSNGKEESVTKAKQNFLWLLLGFFILMIGESIANIFNPETATQEALIDFNAANDQLRIIADYISWLFGSVLVLLMTVSGVRMITAGGKEETLNKEKAHLGWSGIGMLAILLARNIVNAIYVVNSPDNITAGEVSSTITEIASLVRLMLAFLGPITLIFTLYAGLLYVTNFGNDEQLNKAKRLLLAGITGIVIIYAALAITNTLVSAPLVPSI